MCVLYKWIGVQLCSAYHVCFLQQMYTTQHFFLRSCDRIYILIRISYIVIFIFYARIYDIQFYKWIDFQLKDVQLCSAYHECFLQQMYTTLHFFYVRVIEITYQ